MNDGQVSVVVPLWRRGVIVAHALVDVEDAHLTEHTWRPLGAGYAARRHEGRTIYTDDPALVGA